ncbi:hypothetical protein I350_02505 [Cryptococcus amylolentus CBS 6273]|uniref:Uncharacterized protein n=1 Tax=Cryptococcus amylolentus CBS 6273 TaxID=1296118 RepID=A0A1E3KBA8_9TREE|nr:hypothetical protein I350_02505 [Cryptococcus amylolentus CBS 6273]
MSFTSVSPSLGLKDLQKQLELAQYHQDTLLDENSELKRRIDAIESKIENAKKESAMEAAPGATRRGKGAWESRYKTLKGGLESLVEAEKPLARRKSFKRSKHDSAPGRQIKPTFCLTGSSSTDDDDNDRDDTWACAPENRVKNTSLGMQRKMLTAKVLESFRAATAEAHSIRNLPLPIPARISGYKNKGMKKALVRFVIEPNTPGVDRNMFGHARKFCTREGTLTALRAVENRRVRFEALKVGEREGSGEEEME